MRLTRRTAVAGAILVPLAMPAIPAEACTLTATRRPRPFSDRTCRRALDELVALLNAAPHLDRSAIERRLGDTHLRIDHDLAEDLLGESLPSPIETAEVLAGWTLSHGRRDQVPARLAEINHLRTGHGMALYQWTLRRQRFVPEVTEEEASNDDCGFTAARPAHFQREDRAFLAYFVNNRLREVHPFDLWLAEL